jgi:hypothetical protein
MESTRSLVPSIQYLQTFIHNLSIACCRVEAPVERTGEAGTMRIRKASGSAGILPMAMAAPGVHRRGGGGGGSDASWWSQFATAALRVKVAPSQLGNEALEKRYGGERERGGRGALQGGDEQGLSRRLGLLDLILLGIGASIGAGIFVITGTVAHETGPGALNACIVWPPIEAS